MCTKKHAFYAQITLSCFLYLTTVTEDLFMVVLSHFRHTLGGNLNMQPADWLNHCKGLPVGYVVKLVVE